jgi:hypothetical protein
LNFQQLAKQLYTSIGEIQITIQINKSSDEKGVLKKNQLTAVSDIVDFAVFAYANNKEVELKQFMQPIKRSIKIKNEVNVNRSTVVKLNDKGTFTALPSYFDGNQAIFRSMTNSKYTVVKHSQTFSDIKGLWNQEDVERLASKFIIHGRKDGT